MGMNGLDENKLVDLIIRKCFELSEREGNEGVAICNKNNRITIVYLCDSDYYYPEDAVEDVPNEYGIPVQVCKELVCTYYEALNSPTRDGMELCDTLYNSIIFDDPMDYISAFKEQYEKDNLDRIRDKRTFEDIAKVYKKLNSKLYPKD